MCKKLIVLAVIGIVGVYVVNETRAGSHFKAWCGRIGDKLEKKVTPETELSRIRHEVGELDGDIGKVKGDLAEANVSVRLLRLEIDDLRKDVKTAETAVRKHGEVVKGASEDAQIQWGNRTVSYVNAKDLLMSEVKAYNGLKARLKSREQSLASQEQTRDLVEQQLQEMLRQKDELRAAVAEMDNEIKLAKVEQIRSKYQNDGSRMGDIKTSLAELRRRVMVQRENLRLTDTYSKSPASEKSVDEILAGIDNLPSKGPEEVKVIGRDK